MTITHLLLGSNIGDRAKQLANARTHIESKIGVITKRSKIYETAPWGEEKQEKFLNQALEVNTELKPEQVMEAIHDIEGEMKREETYKWGPREIDIDILFYEEEMICEMELTIPHPFLHERKFTLLPLAEIAPKKHHPIMGMMVLDLLLECIDELEVEEYKEPLKGYACATLI